MKYKYRDKEWLKNAIKEYKSAKEISKKYGYSVNSIYVWCRKYNLSFDKERKKWNRKIKLDYNYFNEIDTEEKAYWLGYIMADGCITKSTIDGPYNRLYINCKKEDIEHIVKLKTDLCCDYNIITKCVENKKYNFFSETSELRINSEIIVLDLIKHGISPNKTGKENLPPNIPKKLIRHFIRGFFDGDGSLTIKKTFRICSMSKGILDSINEHFKKELNIELKIYCTNNYSKPFYTFDSNHFKKNKIILDYLYKDAKVFLKRKYDRYVNLYCSTTK